MFFLVFFFSVSLFLTAQGQQFRDLEYGGGYSLRVTQRREVMAKFREFIGQTNIGQPSYLQPQLVWDHKHCLENIAGKETPCGNVRALATSAARTRQNWPWTYTKTRLEQRCAEYYPLAGMTGEVAQRDGGSPSLSSITGGWTGNYTDNFGGVTYRDPDFAALFQQGTQGQVIYVGCSVYPYCEAKEAGPRTPAELRTYLTCIFSPATDALKISN